MGQGSQAKRDGHIQTTAANTLKGLGPAPSAEAHAGNCLPTGSRVRPLPLPSAPTFGNVPFLVRERKVPSAPHPLPGAANRKTPNPGIGSAGR